MVVHAVRPPADCTASASGRCVAPVASKRAFYVVAPPRNPLHHALPGSSVHSFSPPLLEHSRQKPPLLRASVAEMETAVPSADPVRGGQRNGSSAPPVHPIELPQGLRDMVAILDAPNPAAPGGRTTVYVLGMSHVSRRSCEDIEQLVGAVRPDIVLVELCKDRVTGLISEDQVDVRRQHVKRVQITGLPKEEGWPAADQVLALCRTRPGYPVTFQDIEQDSARVLSTGLFKTARPFVRPPRSTTEMYPQFLLDDASGALKALRPLGETEFLVTPRELPQLMSFDARLDSSLRAPIAALSSDSAATASAELSAAISAIAAEALAAARPARGAPAAAAVTSTASDDDAKDEAGAQDGAADTEEGAEKAEEAAKPKRVEAPSTINLLMQARSRIMDAAARRGLASGSFEVLFTGLEEGRVEAALHAVPAGKQAALTGLESSVVDGEGFGIEPFRSGGELIEVGISMKVPLDKVADNLPPPEKPLPVSAADARVSDYRGIGTRLSLWEDVAGSGPTEVDADAEAEEEKAEKDPLAGAGGWLAQELTNIYGGFQEEAGKAAGVESGEPWQVAFRAAAAAGTAQLHLGDRPSDITARKMSDGVWSAVTGPLAASTALLIGSIVGSATGAIPDGLEVAAVGVSLAAVGAAVYPVVGPILEVRQLSKLSGEEVEAAVRPREPMQNDDGAGIVKLTGEDALLDWPNAMGPVIEERDAYMARTLWAAATGAPGASPAFVADTTIDGRTIFRYAMPKDGPEGSFTAQAGDGVYEPLAAPAAVVGVVGTAHVRGIIREWKKAQDISLDRYLTL